MKKKKVLILGLGNDILSDDGIGPKIVKKLEKDLIITNHGMQLDFLTAATGGLEIIEMISGFKRLVLIDAIKTTNGIPGSLYYLTPASFKDTLHISSFHDVSFLTALKMADRLNIPMPERIDILAIEIVEDLVFSDKFSQPVKDKFPEVYQEIMDFVSNMKI